MKLPIPKVEVINLVEGFVVIEGGQVLPIVNYADADGRLCEADEAVGCLAGNVEYGWLAIDISDEDVTFN